jgi:hypothetical protein
MLQGRLSEMPGVKSASYSIEYAGVFLPKHRVGNPGMKGKKNTEHFVQLERGLYRLKIRGDSVKISTNIRVYKSSFLH